MNMTARTGEYPLREGHLVPVSTLATGLARIGRVNFHQSSASFFRFARHLREKRRPGGVCNTLSKTMIMDHAIDVEILNTDHAKGIDNLSALLVGEILSTPRDTFINTSNRLAVLTAFRRTFGEFGVFALDFCQGFLFHTKETRIFDFLSIREGGKGLQAYIDSDALGILWQTLRFSLTGETRIPFAGAALADRTGLGGTLEASMQNNLDMSHLRNKKFAVFERAATWDLRKGERVVSVAPLKPGVSRIFTGFAASKEGFHCQINTHCNILQNLGMHDIQRGTFLFQHRIGSLLLIARQAFSSLLVGIPAFFKR